MTEFICRKAGVPDICSNDPAVKTAAELSGYICTSGEFEENADASAEAPQANFVCRKAGVPDTYGNDRH